MRPTCERCSASRLPSDAIRRPDVMDDAAVDKAMTTMVIIGSSPLERACMVAGLSGIPRMRATSCDSPARHDGQPPQLVLLQEQPGMRSTWLYDQIVAVRGAMAQCIDHCRRDRRLRWGGPVHAIGRERLSTATDRQQPDHRRHRSPGQWPRGLSDRYPGRHRRSRASRGLASDSPYWCARVR